MQEESKGYLYGFLALFINSIIYLTVKTLPSIYPEAYVFFRSSFGLILILPFAYKFRKKLLLANVKLQFIRILCSVLFTFLNFFALKYLALTDVVMLDNLVPLITPLFMLLLFKKNITKGKLLAIFMGFLGVIYAINPTFSLLHWATLCGLGAAVFLSLSTVISHHLSKTDNTFAMMFYFLFFHSIITFIPYSLNNFNHSNISWIDLIFLGLLSFVFLLFITKAYTHGNPAHINSIMYFSIIFAAIYDFIFWGETFTLRKSIGFLITGLSGMYVIFENSLQKIYRNKRIGQKDGFYE